MPSERFKPWIPGGITSQSFVQQVDHTTFLKDLRPAPVNEEMHQQMMAVLLKRAVLRNQTITTTTTAAIICFLEHCPPNGKDQEGKHPRVLQIYNPLRLGV